MPATHGTGQKRSTAATNGDEIPIGLFWRRIDLPTLEELEPVLHTGEGPLAFRNTGIPRTRRKR